MEDSQHRNNLLIYVTNVESQVREMKRSLLLNRVITGGTIEKMFKSKSEGREQKPFKYHTTHHKQTFHINNKQFVLCLY